MADMRSRGPRAVRRVVARGAFSGVLSLPPARIEPAPMLQQGAGSAPAHHGPPETDVERPAAAKDSSPCACSPRPARGEVKSDRPRPRARRHAPAQHGPLRRVEETRVVPRGIRSCTVSYLCWRYNRRFSSRAREETHSRIKPEVRQTLAMTIVLATANAVGKRATKPVSR